MINKNHHKHPGSDALHITSECPHPNFTCHGKQYTVVNLRNGEVLSPGGRVTNFRGDPNHIESVSRGPEHNGTAKVVAGKYEYYDGVFGVDVVPTP